MQAAVGESYAQAVEPGALRDLLAGRRLLIITEPGASASVVTAISAAATADAGATVTGQIALQPKFFELQRHDAGQPGAGDHDRSAGRWDNAGCPRNTSAAGRPGPG